MEQGKVSSEALKNKLTYHPDSGLFTWNYSVGRAKEGHPAGCINKTTGYLHIGLDGKRYQAHRLAWLYVYGENPENEIDHINGNCTDNRIENLRKASRKENARNQGKRKNNTSGYKGVYFHKSVSRFQARIRVDNKLLHLGMYATQIEAHKAYMKAAKKYFGEFFRE